MHTDLFIESPAPVEIIRGLASEFLDHQSPKAKAKYATVGAGEDIVSKGIVTEDQAQELLDMSVSLQLMKLLYSSPAFFWDTR
jgi:hypothetical protein